MKFSDLWPGVRNGVREAYSLFPNHSASSSPVEVAPTWYLPPGETVGAFLSGGLDSSCITALAAKFHDSPVHTYSIHFGADCPNELEYSSLVAEHCQIQHHMLEITPAQMWEHLPETMAYLDDPIGDPLTVPAFIFAVAPSE